MSYFKISTPEAIAAWEGLWQKDADLRKEGQSFADLFSGKAVFINDLTRVSFYGVRFDGTPYGSAALWTQPNERKGYACWPKAKAPRGMNEEHKALIELWRGQEPIVALDKTVFYPAIGLEWGILFLTGLGMFRRGNTIYFETGATPKPEIGAIEILGSEFKAAKQSSEAPKEKS
ncbi:hypothetical protein Z042_22950 [Chania multitudinisentens RB-25]|uniref:Uncharacterized protein n=1 Tax=Chania multitudinisentens RB-25 TaxID=1441930 RepID=W0LGX1_9GAMM|nr:hypothetical protein [Chania multitudinisentens]AHG22981.1 hypothetical protein Z042_22950 [Chania multitudinisentens RB-25]